jgi:hypothetical protein
MGLKLDPSPILKVHIESTIHAWLFTKTVGAKQNAKENKDPQTQE